MRGLYSTLALIVTALIGLAASADWSLNDAKLTISSIDGSGGISESFTTSKAPSTPSPLDVNMDAVIRLAFTLQSSGGEKLKADELPHQVVVSLADAHDPLRIASTIVTVKPSTGKASWNQRIDRLPSILTRGSSELQATLLIASFGDTKSIKLSLLKFRLPTSISDGKSTARDNQEIQQGFQRHLERRHTFNIPAAEHMPPKFVSLVATAVTLLVPSIVLAFLLSQILPSLSMRSPSTATAPFLASLFSLEFIALLYWLGRGFTLFKMMPWLLAIGTVSIFVGRTALSEMKKVRIGLQM